MLEQRYGLIMAALLTFLIVPVHAEVNSTASATKHKAISTLLTEATEHIEQQAFDAAGATLERALRIDSRDAEIWQLLSELRSLQGDRTQAEAMAAKAATLRQQIAQVETPPDLLAPTDNWTIRDRHPSADQDNVVYIDNSGPRTPSPEQDEQIASVEVPALPQRAYNRSTSSQSSPIPLQGEVQRPLAENSLTTTIKEHEQKPTRAYQEAVAQALQAKQLIRQLQVASAREQAKAIVPTTYIVATPTDVDSQAVLQAKKAAIRQKLAERQQRIRQRLHAQKRAIAATLQRLGNNQAWYQ